MKIFWIMILITALTAVSCKTTNRVVFTNLAALYDPETDLDISGVRIYHLNESISTVFLRYKTSGLEYRMVPGLGIFEAEYKFSYQLFSSFDSSEILDSGTFVFNDTLREDFSDKFFDFQLKANYPGSYLLEITFTDIYADEEILYFDVVEKESRTTRQNFLPLNEAGEVIFEDYFDWKTRFWITASQNNIAELSVDYYKKKFPPALPPFSGKHAEAYQLEPDSVFSIYLEDGVSDIFQYAGEGIFHYRPDALDKNGVTFFRFEDYFPQLKRPEQLIPPLRYLCSNNEFEQLTNSEDAKVAVDEFWLSIGGSEERAVELIQKYYGRVEEANRLFSSYKEGWKTDRGMIYIIFGEPVTVYRRDDIETWIYGRQGERVFLTFDFIRAINPFTSSDFELQRKPEYKQQWYNAVWFWRR